MIERLEREAGKNWNVFYKHNEANFFKDRHYIHKELTELTQAASLVTPANITLLDVGCGVGNAFYPLLSIINNLKVNALDFSAKAIDCVKVQTLA